MIHRQVTPAQHRFCPDFKVQAKFFIDHHNPKGRLANRDRHDSLRVTAVPAGPTLAVASAPRLVGSSFEVSLRCSATVRTGTARWQATVTVPSGSVTVKLPVALAGPFPVTVPGGPTGSLSDSGRSHASDGGGTTSGLWLVGWLVGCQWGPARSTPDELLSIYFAFLQLISDPGIKLQSYLSLVVLVALDVRGRRGG